MSVTIYPGGFFRSRDGYKYVCVEERKDAVCPFGAVRVDLLTSLIWVDVNGRNFEDTDTLSDLVEEVHFHEPVYVDPLAPVPLPEQDVWGRVGELINGFELHRFSSKTNVQDVKAAGMPASMRVKLDRTNVHKVWRCRSGRGSAWYYGWSKDEAIENLLSGGASPRRAKGRT